MVLARKGYAGPWDGILEGDASGLRGAYAPVMVWRPYRLDAAVAGLFVAWAMTEVAVGAVSGSPAVDVPTGLLATLPLVWRRRFPEASALLCASGVALKTVLGTNMDGLAMLTAVFLAAWTVGRNRPLQNAVMVVAVMVGMVWAVLWRVPDGGIYDWVFALIWIGGPGAAGAGFRYQLDRVAVAAGRAARAELLRDEHARQAVRAERDRIAREMHDTLAHTVSVMVLHAGAVRSRLPETLASERAALADSEETGRRAISDLRRLLGLLRTESGPAEVAPQPTLTGLDDLVAQTRALGLDVDLRVDGDPSGLDGAIQVSAYRIVQEALTNVRKHAGARHIDVVVRCSSGGVDVRVTDDGRGVSQGDREGFGLVGVRERVEVYGGRLSAGPAPTGGFLLEASLPGERPA